MGRQAEQFYDDKNLLERILVAHSFANLLLVRAQPGAEYFGAKAIGGGQAGMGAGFYYYFLLGWCLHCCLFWYRKSHEGPD
jgi:hypothetical protein